MNIFLLISLRKHDSYKNKKVLNDAYKNKKVLRSAYKIKKVLIDAHKPNGY